MKAREFEVMAHSDDESRVVAEIMDDVGQLSYLMLTSEHAREVARRLMEAAAEHEANATALARFKANLGNN